MTLSSERYRSVRYLKQVAMMIYLRGKERPTLSKFRKLFRNALKHYPSEYDMRQVS